MDNEKHRDGKDVLVGDIESRLHLQAIIFLHQPAKIERYMERYMEGAIFSVHGTKKNDPIMATTNLFENIINIYPLEDVNGIICHLILVHVLMQMKCCLFPVILSSTMLCTMIAMSLVHVCENLEQNAKMFDVDVPPDA